MKRKRPSPLIVVRGLLAETSEAQVICFIVAFNISKVAEALAPYISTSTVGAFEYVRLVRDRAGRSKGIALIRCHSLQAAQTLILTQERVGGHLLVGGPQCPVNLDYGHENPIVEVNDDWLCRSCSARNYPKRLKCHRCQVPRNNAFDPGPVIPVGIDGSDDISSTPSRFLLLRNLSIEHCVSAERLLSDLGPGPNRIFLSLDPEHEPLGFAFVEYPSVISC